MSNVTANSRELIRSLIWSQEIKDVMRDELMAQMWVRWLEEFPDGDTFNIPSINGATVRDYTEDTDIVFDAFDKGNFEFEITEYLSSATYITDKNKQDMFYLAEFEAMFIPEQRRAIMEHVETEILKLANSQVASDPNSILGADHRYVATGGSDGARITQPADFAKAKFALTKARVPMINLVAIVDPATAYHLETTTNLVNLSNNP